MTFSEARALKIGDKVHRPDDADHFGVIADIKRGAWRVNWNRNSGAFVRREEIPMGCVSKMEPLK